MLELSYMEQGEGDSYATSLGWQIPWLSTPSISSLAGAQGMSVWSRRCLAEGPE